MKRIKYNYLSCEYNCGTDDNPDIKRLFIPKDFSYSDDALEAAKKEAYNGEYIIYDDDQPEPETAPTQLDLIEAQVTYTAMMTDTLLEV